MADSAARLTRKQLQVEYEDEVSEIVRSETDALGKTIVEDREKAKTAETRATKAEGEVTTLTGKVTEMTKAHETATKRAETAEAQVKEMRAAVRLGAVKDALGKDIDARIDTAKKDQKTAAVEVPILEMARKDLALDASVLVENDDKDETLSRKAAGAKFDAVVARVREMASKFGAPKTGTVAEIAGGTRTTDHPGASEAAAERARFLPSVAKRIARETKEKEGAGTK
jgi:hypothetical protein